MRKAQGSGETQDQVFTLESFLVEKLSEQPLSKKKLIELACVTRKLINKYLGRALED